MKLRIDDITAEVKALSFPEPEQEINLTLGLGPISEYRVEGPIGVSLEYYRAGMDLFFSGELRAVTLATCARCAEEFTTAAARPFRYVMAPAVAGLDGKGGVRNEDLEFSTYTGEEVDLTPLIREQMLLALQNRPLCREDCRGLCATCGANLNEGSCGCIAVRFDPRLAVIRSLKVRRPN